MTKRRLPSFNDFSPGLFPDIREPLIAVARNHGNRDKIVSAISALKKWPVSNKRAKNVVITLRNTGLFNGDEASLTPLGQAIADASSPLEAARLFCKHILENMNGRVLVDAVRSLNRRAERVSKESLKRELVRLRISGLATATTDHSTLANWMAAAGVLIKAGNDYSVDDLSLKSLISISSEEGAELEQLESPQRLFLVILRRLAVTEGGKWLPTGRLISECLRDYPRIFDEDQFRKKVIGPLREQGWIAIEGLTSGRGAKSGKVRAEPKLLGIPVEYLMPNFDSAVPPDLRGKVDTPLAEIEAKLESPSKHDRGLALELLALRVILDLSLSPRGFRRRAKSTGYAEVDVTAEGANLLFSRWMFQCKAIGRTAKVGVEDVAREVGIAIHAKAHVIVMVTTGSFSRVAMDFAREITSSTPLQFLFLDGKLVREYLTGGASKLIDHVLQNAGDIMKQKQEQVVPSIMNEELTAGS